MARKSKTAADAGTDPGLAVPVVDTVLVRDGVVQQLWMSTPLTAIPDPDTLDGELVELPHGSVWPGARYTRGGVVLPPTVSIAQLRRRAAESVAVVVAEHQAALGMAAGAEASTWAAKRAEASAVLADPDAECPMLTAECAETGETIAVLTRKVLANADRFNTRVAALTGLRRTVSKQIETAKADELAGLVEAAEARAAAIVAD